MEPDGFRVKNAYVKLPCMRKRMKIGVGLFAKTEIPKGAFIGEYTGAIKRLSEEDPDSQYKMQPKNREFTVDARDPTQSSFVRYTNHPLCFADQNAMFKTIRGRVYLVAIKDIGRGDEILAFYSKSYHRNIVDEIEKHIGEKLYED